MNEMPNVSFICSGENALELSSAICCAGKLMRLLKDEGFCVSGCYSCISPSERIAVTARKLRHMCSLCDLVITVGCEGFRPCDVIPDITRAVSDRDADFFSGILGGNLENTDNGNFPSRAFAGFCSGALIMNLPCDVITARKRLSSLLPSVRYAVAHSKGRDVLKTGTYEDVAREFFSK